MTIDNLEDGEILDDPKTGPSFTQSSLQQRLFGSKPDQHRLPEQQRKRPAEAEQRRHSPVKQAKLNYPGNNVSPSFPVLWPVPNLLCFFFSQTSRSRPCFLLPPPIRIKVAFGQRARPQLLPSPVHRSSCQSWKNSVGMRRSRTRTRRRYGLILRRRRCRPTIRRRP